MTGGYSQTGGGTQSSTEIFDTTSLTWSTGVSLPYGTYRHAIVSVGSNEFVLTGGSGGTTRAEKFNSNTGTWTSLPSYSIARLCHFSFVASYQGKTVVFIGGGSSSASKTSTEYIDLTLVSPTWQTGPTLPKEEYCGTALTTSRGDTYIIGDQNSASIVTYASDQFTLVSGTVWNERRGFTVAVEIPKLP
jgi:hypothetical protein